MNAPFPASEEPDTYTDYVQHAEPSLDEQLLDRLTERAESARDMVLAVCSEYADLEARVGDVIRQMQAAGNDYWAGILADALTNTKEKS